MKTARHNSPDAGLPKSKPKFEIGEIVRHTRLGYRALIGGVDPAGLAGAVSEREHRLTAPDLCAADRNQPRYLLFVDGAAHGTYVPEEYLTVDTSGEPVQHPYMTAFLRPPADAATSAVMSPGSKHRE